MNIRKANKDDYLLLRNMAKSCKPLDVHTPYTYWMVCNFFHDGCFIAEEDGIAAGSIMTIKGDDYVFIWQIGVVSEFRGKGLSQQLYKSVLDYARECRLKKIILSIAPDNDSSNFAFKKFCEKNELNLVQSGICNIEIPDEQFFEKENLYEIIL